MFESSSEVIEITGSLSDPFNDSLSSRRGNYRNNLLRWYARITTWLKSMLYPTVPQQEDQKWMWSDRQTKASTETLGQSLRKKIYDARRCDLHDILSENEKVSGSKWEFFIGKNDKAIQITERFHKHCEYMMKPSKFVDSVDKIKELYLECAVDYTGRRIVELLKEARETLNPEYVVRAFIRSAEFCKQMNIYMATNAHHFLTLDCTILNCPALHLTQDYVDAFTSILLHPELDKYRIGNIRVYRGIVLENEELLKDYVPGNIILTTTFLSTYKNHMAAKPWCDVGVTNKKSVFCTYNIHNAQRHSALDLRYVSQFPEEDEVLILRYVPFRITANETDANGRINICFEEYSGEVLEPPQQESNNCDSIALRDIRAQPENSLCESCSK